MSEIEAKRLIIKGEVKELTFEELLEQYKKAISKLTKKHSYLCDLNDVDKEDVEQMIKFGLYKAYVRYDVSKGYEFSTLAFPYLEGLVLRKYRDETCRYKVPFYKNNKSMNDVLYVGKYGAEVTYEDSLEDDFDLELSSNDEIFIEEFKNKVNKSMREDESKVVIGLLLENKTQMQLSEEIGITQVQVSRLFRRNLDLLKRIVRGDMKVSKKDEIIKFIEKNKGEERKEVEEAIQFMFAISKNTAKTYYQEWKNNQSKTKDKKVKEIKPKEDIVFIEQESKSNDEEILTTDEAVEYIFSENKEDDPVEEVKNLTVNKDYTTDEPKKLFQPKLKIKKAVIEGDYGTYEIENGKVRTGTEIFSNIDEVDEYKQKEIANFVKSIEEIKSIFNLI